MKSIRKKMENKGFTLVEIIVCLAIMTIVAGSVGAFIVTGNNSAWQQGSDVTGRSAAGSQSDDRSDH